MSPNWSNCLDTATEKVLNVQGRFLIYIVLLISLHTSFSQEVSIKGGFIEDSLKIGENIRYWITASYPEQFQLVFPDSNANFSPFEFVSKSYTPTEKRADLFFDSAIYHLQSFEIDSVQYLKLPAVALYNKDSLLIHSNVDSIFLVHLVPMVSDTTQLKSNTAYWKVSDEINQPLLWIIFGILVVLLVGAYLLFGKKVRRYFILKKLSKDYQKFIEKLTDSIRSMKDNPEQKLVENALNDWKVFLERMEKKPYTKLTSKEILGFEETRELKDALKNIDRYVYGGRSTDELYKDFQSIEDFTQHRYTIVVDEIKNKP